MRHSAAEDDLPTSRRAIEQVATKFNIYFLLAMGLLSACLFIAGLIGTAKRSADALDRLPDSAMMMAVGIIGFALFFPWFTAVYFARHLLHSVKRLERENAELREEIAAARKGVA
jgi:hypothetical protein